MGEEEAGLLSSLGAAWAAIELSAWGGLLSYAWKEKWKAYQHIGAWALGEHYWEEEVWRY